MWLKLIYFSGLFMFQVPKYKISESKTLAFLQLLTYENVSFVSTLIWVDNTGGNFDLWAIKVILKPNLPNRDLIPLRSKRTINHMFPPETSDVCWITEFYIIPMKLKLSLLALTLLYVYNKMTKAGIMLSEIDGRVAEDFHSPLII